MTTAQQVIDSCRHDYILTGQRDQVNRLTTTLDSSTTTVAFDFELKGVQEGSVISIDLELMYVWSTSPAAKTATVQRGWEGSTAASHTSGAVIRVNPKVSDFDIFGAINDELRSLSSPLNGLFKVVTADLTYNAAVSGYNLTGATDVIDVLEVRYDTPGVDQSWPIVRSFDVARSMPTADFASATAVMLHEGGYPGQSIRVRYSAPFTLLSTAADVVETVSGIPSTAVDILSIGAAIRLSAGRPIRRSQPDTQGDTRRAAEATTQDTLMAPNGLRALHRARVNEEAARLRSMYPPRLR